MRKINTYTSLRDSESESASDFYNNLADKTLKCVGVLASYDLGNCASVSDIKDRMGINYGALAKMVSYLEHKKYVSLNIEDKSGVSEISPNHVCVKLTQEGLNAILKEK